MSSGWTRTKGTRPGCRIRPLSGHGIFRDTVWASPDPGCYSDDVASTQRSFALLLLSCRGEAQEGAASSLRSLTCFRSAPHLTARNHVRHHHVQHFDEFIAAICCSSRPRDDVVRYEDSKGSGAAAQPNALPPLSAVHSYR